MTMRTMMTMMTIMTMMMKTMIPSYMASSFITN